MSGRRCSRLQADALRKERIARVDDFERRRQFLAPAQPVRPAAANLARQHPEPILAVLGFIRNPETQAAGEAPSLAKHEGVQLALPSVAVRANVPVAQTAEVRNRSRQLDGGLSGLSVLPFGSDGDGAIRTRAGEPGRVDASPVIG